MYTEFPSSVDYMKRLIMRLAPEYSGDTVRLAILKRFVEGCDVKCRTIKVAKVLEWAKERLSDEDKDKYGKLNAAEKKKFLVSKLTDDVFESMGVEPSPLQKLGLMAKRMKKCIDEPEKYYIRNAEGERVRVYDYQLSENMLKALNGLCAANGIPTDGRVFERIGLLADCGGLENDEMFAELYEDLEYELVEYLKTIFHIKREGEPKRDKNGNIKLNIHGEPMGLVNQAYELYENDKGDLRKKLNESINVLAICDDLASGRFCYNGITKVNLYYFAFMFGMKVSLSGDGYVGDELDVEKNLFYDYYTDNMMRYLIDDNAEGEPTGEGINYKSFVECIYIYYLNKPETGKTPGERIDKANRMLDRCVKRGSSGISQTDGITGNTGIYRDLVADVLMDMDEKQLEEFICENFKLADESNKNIARIMIAAEEITAYQILDAHFEERMELFRDSAEYDRILEISKDDARTRYELNLGDEWNLYHELAAKFGDDPSFMRVLNAVYRRLDIKNHGLTGYAVPIMTNEMERRKDNEAFHKKNTKKARVTRSGMIAEAFNRLREFGMEVFEGCTSLMEVYDAFANEVNGDLEASRYQLLNPKNMLDMCAVLTLYYECINEMRINAVAEANRRR